MKNSLEKLNNKLRVKKKEKCQIKTCMCFLFSQPIIGCPLLKGKFCSKKVYALTNVCYKSVRYIEAFL